MKKAIIKKGDKYNQLTAIKFIEIRGNSNQYWLFKCSCGNEKIIRVVNVKNGGTKSCGCLLGKMFKHGMYKTKTYRSWQSMKIRCLNENCKEYKYYGNRGIKICDRWLKFENFYEDMGERSQGKTLDRKNNDKGYYKENCQWATPKEQANNRRNNLIY